MTCRLGVPYGHLASALVFAGCSSLEPLANDDGATIQMRFDAPDAFYVAPFPSDHRLGAHGVDLSSFPNPDRIPFVDTMVSLLDGRATGFGVSAGVFFTVSHPIDPESLPELFDTIRGGSSVYLLSIDPTAPDYLARYPVTVQYQEQGGPFGAPRMLSLVPLQGVPLRAETAYAAIVSTDVRAADGRPLAVPPAIRELAAGRAPPGLEGAGLATYQLAVDALAASGASLDQTAGIAAFTTWDPTTGMAALAAHARTLTTPSPTIPWELTDTFDDYCVYQSQLEMPVYQTGEAPYQDAGGEIVFDQGEPQLDHRELARAVVTVPRGPMPSSGWPVVVMVRTGGGGDRPLVDRGVRDADGVVASPGSGPALHFARAGYAGASVDGPHGGIRNVTGGDEQFLIFNISNPTAMRDNIRQSALELALLPDVLADLRVDVSSCPQAVAPGDEVSFDLDRVALMGHSMGATIAPLTLAVEPRFRAGVLSGAGGSWIENVVHKQSPVAVRGLAEVLLHYPGYERHLHDHDPVLSLLQWAGEPADPPLYAHRLIDETQGEAPRHVLMLQGIVDTYILPPIANATSLSVGLDLAGEPLDEGHPELSDFRPLEPLLPLVARQRIGLPASGNRDGVTAVVVQHPEGPIEDGHEVVFQTAAPKHQYRCFLDTLRQGTPIVPVGADELAPCAP